MQKRMALNDEALENVNGGMMKFSGGDNVMTYTNNEGTVTKYNIIGSAKDAYVRSCLLHAEIINDEDQILSILISEGYIGSQIV